MDTKTAIATLQADVAKKSATRYQGKVVNIARDVIVSISGGKDLKYSYHNAMVKYCYEADLTRYERALMQLHVYEYLHMHTNHVNARQVANQKRVVERWPLW